LFFNTPGNENEKSHQTLHTIVLLDFSDSSGSSGSYFKNKNLYETMNL